MQSWGGVNIYFGEGGGEHGVPWALLFRGPLDNSGECLETLNGFLEPPVPAPNPPGQMGYQKLNSQNIRSTQI